MRVSQAYWIFGWAFFALALVSGWHGRDWDAHLIIAAIAFATGRILKEMGR